MCPNFDSNNYPLISIITVNFNGKKFLSGLFNSILNLNYPSNKLQIIMVDNSSTDNSADFVNKNFPVVEVLRLKKNSGFAGGNNQGFKIARGRYIALINNDCVVEKEWLKGMLSVFGQNTSDSFTGAVGSKVVFYYPYLPLKFIADKNSKVKISRVSIKVKNSKKNINKSFKDSEILNFSIKYLDGFFVSESDGKGNLYYGIKKNGLLAVPVYDLNEDINFEFKVWSDITPDNLKIAIGENFLKDIKIEENPKTVKFVISKSFFNLRKDIINSSGTEINRSFYSRDRGYLEIDKGRFNLTEEVFSLSGSSFLIDRKMLDDTGYFNKKFFTYYEDIDLFWRARLRGWKMYFSPFSIARHFHCGTGKEWSYNFTYYVLRNRLLMIFRCGWPMLFMRCYIAFVLSTAINLFYYIAGILRGRKSKRIDIPIRIRIFFELFYLLPKNLPSRLKIRWKSKISDGAIKGWIRDF